LTLVAQAVPLIPDEPAKDGRDRVLLLGRLLVKQQIVAFRDPQVDLPMLAHVKPPAGDSSNLCASSGHAAKPFHRHLRG